MGQVSVSDTTTVDGRWSAAIACCWTPATTVTAKRERQISSLPMSEFIALRISNPPYVDVLCDLPDRLSRAFLDTRGRLSLAWVHAYISRRPPKMEKSVTIHSKILAQPRENTPAGSLADPLPPPPRSA
jgi:hypothetical protein